MLTSLRFPRAKCLGLTRMFFSEYMRDLQAAMTLCQSCSHLKECRKMAHETGPHKTQVLGGQYWTSRGHAQDKIGYGSGKRLF